MISQDDLEEITYEMERAKFCATCWTVIYLILFPMCLYGALLLLAGMVFDNAAMTKPIGATLIFFSFWIPISIPVTIYLMWSRYSRGQYRKTRRLWSLPLLITLAVGLLSELLLNLLPD